MKSAENRVRRIVRVSLSVALVHSSPSGNGVNVCKFCLLDSTEYRLRFRSRDDVSKCWKCCGNSASRRRCKPTSANREFRLPDGVKGRLS